ncbi:MAG TPA: TIGR03085 family metal-binding protein [Jiangellales bacterium]|nr:TIGR03085 family metal-binding protein [Jiangellales bacterium]
MSGFARTERQDLARTLLEVGPEAPTLCEGWRARDLAAHLVVRETRPDAAPGIVVRPLRGWTAKVQRDVAAQPYEQLVERFRRPPLWAPMSWGPVEEVANLTEHFVHHEDVRRAVDGWQPRRLPTAYDEALWRTLETRGRVFFARSPVGVVLRLPDGRTTVARPGTPAVTLVGPAQELVLYAFGRTDHALVEVEGDAETLSAFRGSSLGI